jgi:tetraacyldisaccharide 4'-kinase
MMRAPGFWWRSPGLGARLLQPLGALYGGVVARRMSRDGMRSPLPVICVGNFSAGGAGKTPFAIELAHHLMRMGERPAFLTRGYGGTYRGPIMVEASRHRALDVGDEALLLARHAMTVVARARDAGARLAESAGASVIVMDDGWQNPSLCKDLAIAVLDGRRGIGNGRVFPAGPLRAPLESQLDRADALMLIGPPAAGAEPAIAAAQRRGLPRFEGELAPDPTVIATLAGARVLAFAGIADPDKFFATLEAGGVAVVARRGFADHHRFTEREVAALLALADRERLMPVTTEKDLARLAGDPRARELVARTTTLLVTLTLGDPAGFERMVLGALGARQAADSLPMVAANQALTSRPESLS